MITTFEQKEIIFAEHKEIYIKAFAGVGKTSTLLEYVKARKFDSFLYIVYNSSLREEAISKFPAYVDIHTIHSYAYEKIGHLYRPKLKNDLTADDIYIGLPYFSEKDINDEEVFKLASSIASVINGFCSSSLMDFDNCPGERYIVKMAHDYWLRMIDLKDLSTPITHDGYLKIFQLSSPKLDYDYILVDEAQDSNEVMLDLIYSQEANRIFVGDSHQGIYSFRGSIDIFSAANRYFNAATDYIFLSLTKSFRFGHAVANVANKILTTYKYEDVPLIGNEDIESEIGELDKSVQYTILARTNSKIFDLAVKHSTEGKTIHIVGGLDFLIDKVLDGYYLYTNQHDKIKNKSLKKFKNYRHLKTIAENLRYPEYLFLVKIIDLYGDTLEDRILLIKRHHTGLKTADVILSTVHKAKGLEFVSVLISDDFIPLYDKNGLFNNPAHLDPEEINLLYVAITRATYYLELNADLFQLMNE